jgi:predicted aspartyl protease
LQHFTVIVTLIGVLALVAPQGIAAASSETAHAATVIPVVVIKRHGSVAVFTEIRIHGRPFLFQVDTGAERTLVDPAVTRQLHLALGAPVTGCGITGCAVAHRVRLENWSIGGQALPPTTAVSTLIFGAASRRIGFGLLGSDVLSKFGSVTIDYLHGTMTLG